MRIPLRLFALGSALGLARPSARVHRDTAVPIETVDLDIGRYLGRWYAVAHYPTRFEQGCAATTADYSLRSDGLIRVVNACRKGGLAGRPKRITGKARVVGPGKLVVTFVAFLPFTRGDYWVLHVGPDYRFAVVGEPGGRAGWVLSRSPVLAEADWQEALAALERAGYDPAGLERIEQPNAP
jgi:apolipoprotein D and lipocalin family protein